MSWTPLLLALSALCAGAAAQFVLTQPSSVSVPPGQTARVPCVMSSGFSIGDYYTSWYQQRPGSPPRYLLWFVSDSSKGQGAGVPARFSASKDPSSNTFHLLITGALGEDEADYYCLGYYGSTGQYIFGGGTQLNVLTGETKAPTLSIFPPSQEEVEKNKATVVCLCQDFYPASLDVTWKVGDQTITNGVEKSRATKQSENNLFMASSYLSLPTKDWSADKTVTCQVTHQGKTFEKSVKKSECF